MPLREHIQGVPSPDSMWKLDGERGEGVLYTMYTVEVRMAEWG